MAQLDKGLLRKKITELEPALEGRLEEHHRFLLELQLRRLQAAEEDLAVLEGRGWEKDQHDVAGQVAVSYTYDNGNRPTGITQGSSAVSLAYDNTNRRTSLTLPNGVQVAYSYDPASQLTGLTYTLGTTTLGNLTYSYDGTGRRTSVGGSFARTGLPLAVASATYDAANEQTKWGAASPTYDANGNLTNDGVNTYTWDARNHLKSVTAGSTTLGSFIYDAFGRRMNRTLAGTATSLLYDVVNVAQELSGTTPTANLFSGAIDEVFTRTDSAGARSFLTDALGSTVALTDSTGALQTQYTYDPFGASSFSGLASGNFFQFTGRENDGTGLYYYRARYSNPATNRFISEDPMGFQGGINLYAYAGNMPPNFGDPTGLLPMKVHYGLTYSLAKQIFGSACEGRAETVAQADADQDKISGLVATVEFVMGMGNAWKKGSIHFGGPVDQLLQSAFTTCDDKTLGNALHGLQDDMSHIGPYANPRVHYWTSILDLITSFRPDHGPADNPGAEQMQAISDDSASILRAYKIKCVKCGQ